MPRRQPYEYDVALSFAGEERRYAETLAEILRAAGLSVFYDKHHEVTLWGKDQREFERIYGPASRFVAPFISEHYVRKDWPRFEFDTARREERNRSSHSILPIRVDNSRLVGLDDSRVYLSLSEHSIEEIAACLIEKCKEADAAPIRQPRAKPTSKTTQRVAILSGAAKHALGILVVSHLPLPQGLYESLFPDIDWSTHCRTLKKYGLIRTSAAHLTPSADAVKAIRSDNAEQKFSTDRWAKRLEELQDHPDIALYLSIHYMSEGRWNDVIAVLVDVANNGLHGHLNATYYQILERFTHQKVLRQLAPILRIKLFHALAICASHADRFEEALGWFEKVRSESVKAGDDHWLGQYFINYGVVLDLSGDTKGAAIAFQNAIAHGKEHNEPSLVGRSLGNLAQIRMRDNEPDVAVESMRQSIEWKKRAKDDHGSAISSAQLGSIEAKRGNLRAALEHFVEAESLCAEGGLTYEQAKTAYHIGNVYVDLRQYGNALKAYKRARRLAADDECLELRLLATQAIGRACHSLGRFDEIEREFNELLESPSTTNHSESKLTAYHGLGIAQVFQGRLEEGRANLTRALQLARKQNQPQWAVKALVGLAGTFEDGSFVPPAPYELARLAAKEEKRQSWTAATRLWDLSGDAYVRAGDTRKAEVAFSSAAACCDKSGEHPQKLLASHFKLYAWRWRAGLYDKAIDALQQAETLATAHRLNVEFVSAIDERGLALQRLGRSREALSLHQRAVRLARKRDLPTQLRTSLNNLGQAHTTATALR